MNGPTPMCILVSLDLESTGRAVYVDQITEIGAQTALFFDDETFTFLRIKDSDEDFSKYVKCQRAISAKSQKITGITEQKLTDAESIYKVLNMFASYIISVCSPYASNIPRILVAHNGRKFDLPMLVAEIERAKISAVKFFRQLRFDYLLDSLVLSRDVVDTVLLPRDKDGRPCFKLGGVYEALCGTPLVGAHGALADCAAVLKMMLEQDCFKKAFIKDFKSKTDKKYLTNLMTVVTDIVKDIPKTTTSCKGPPVKKTKTMLHFFAPVVRDTNQDSFSESDSTPASGTSSTSVSDSEEQSPDSHSEPLLKGARSSSSSSDSTSGGRGAVCTLDNFVC